MNGFISLLKPPGMTSAAVVAVVRRQLDGLKVGHAGTLDPQAAGVLPIMAGRAARLFDYLVDKEKEYVAEVAFGCSTDTQDAEGTVLETGTNYPDRAAVELLLPRLLGKIVQVPSAFSAIKQHGQPLYAMARRGEEVDVPARQVTVYSLTLGDEMPNHGFMLKIRCGRGTYIRTLCHDLGRLAGCPAHMRFLLRTESGFFTLENAVTLEEVAEAKLSGQLDRLMLPLDAPLQHMNRVDVPSALARPCRNGAKLDAARFTHLPQDGRPFRIYLHDEFYGIGELTDGRVVFRAQIPPEVDDK